MLDCRAEDFFLPAGHHYLNCAYMAPMARLVEQAGIEGIRAKRGPGRIEPSHFFETGEEIRTVFARLIGADDAGRIALIPAASYGLATAARNLPVGSGQSIITVHEQFPSHVYTWQRLAASADARVVTVEPGSGAGRRDRWNDRILEAIDRNTAVVAVPHVHWADGTLFDLVRIGARCREVGAALIVDGTQSVGALPFDVQAIRPDALVCAGYKWLLGPYSMGVAYFGPRFDQGIPLEENWIARKDSQDFAGLVNYQSEYGPAATRYDVGERSNFILAPMLLAALNMLDSWGIENIQDYCHTIAAPILSEASRLGYGVEASSTGASHLFGLRMPTGTDIISLKAELARRNVSVAIRGDAIRVSPNVYNTPDDARALIEGLAFAASP
jgi:selenocysteine lyase/cysteine desulfurase